MESGTTLRGFNSYLVGSETINIPEIFSGVHGFTGKTVKQLSGNFPKVQMPGGLPGGLPGMLKLRFDWYITCTLRFMLYE